jgi:hypothetical protein
VTLSLKFGTAMSCWEDYPVAPDLEKDPAGAPAQALSSSMAAPAGFGGDAAS